MAKQQRKREVHCSELFSSPSTGTIHSLELTRNKYFFLGT